MRHLDADDVVFSDKFLKLKYKNQVAERGWNNQSIADAINNPIKTTKSVNRHTDNSVTLYYIDDVQYVAVDDATKKVIQVSDKRVPDWKPDNFFKLR